MASKQRTNSTERDVPPRVIVVGGGVSGLAAARGLARAGVPVLLLSRCEPRRAPSVIDTDGFNAACSRGDSPEKHLADTLAASEGLGATAATSAMVKAAPALLEELLGLGVAFQPEAIESPGNSRPRTFYCGSSTGQQLLYALDDALRVFGRMPVRDRFRAATTEPLVERRIGWDMLRLVFDDDRRVVGVVAREVSTGVLKAFRGQAVCLATGGFAGLYGGSAASLQSAGSAIGVVVRQGALLANPDLLSFRPLSVPGSDKSFGLPEYARTLGARIFSCETGSSGAERDRDYYVERAHPTAFRSIGAKALARLMPTSISSFIDFTHLPEAEVLLRVGSAFDVLRRRGLGDGLREPLHVEARPDSTLGGLWVDHEVHSDGSLKDDSPRNHATNLPGLFAVGECAHLYEGAGMLAGNAMLAALFGGNLAATAIASYTASIVRSAFDLPPSLFEKAESREREALGALGERKAANDTNAFRLRRELVELMCTRPSVDGFATPAGTLEKDLDALLERSRAVTVADTSNIENRGLELASALGEMVLVARAASLAAGARANSARANGNEPTPLENVFVRFDGELRLVAEASAPRSDQGATS
jgi:succinate dehydrogenase / fumarate reductase, flavoprotein subunit